MLKVPVEWKCRFLTSSTGGDGEVHEYVPCGNCVMATTVPQDTPVTLQGKLESLDSKSKDWYLCSTACNSYLVMCSSMEFLYSSK